MTSLRRIQLLKANRPKINRVAARIRGSLNVAKASAPKTAYAISAIAKRFIIPAAVIYYKKWCTGKDSNLRTSLGGTDLQSVGFNHSPTCAQPPGDAANLASSSGQSHTGRKALGTSAGHGSTLPLFCPRPPELSKLSFCQSGKTKTRAYGLPRRSLHAGIVPNGVRWKTCCDAYTVPLPAGTSLSDAGAGEGI